MSVFRPDEFVWQGDLDDDCQSVANALMLRAEQMGRKSWWWAVYDNNGRAGCNQIAASYDHEDGRARTGREARILAERAAWKHIAFVWASE
jgi:hypothetical protein